MKKVIVICGPTAVGKTKLSIELAKEFDGEIINADSTQIFRELDIGTAKVTEEEKEGIVHHLLDICSPLEDYTVYDYQKDCRYWIEDILKRGKTPILVGGTGLYIKAALYDYEFEEEKNQYSFEGKRDEELYQELLEKDPSTAIHPHNRKRIERALCYYYNHGKPMSTKKNAHLLYDAIFIGLTTNREILYERINKRVYKMLEDGLLEEAKRLYDLPIRSKAIMTPICYKELFDYFDAKISLEDAIELIQKRSRHYAKRQYTWFRNQLPMTWVEVDFQKFSNTVLEVKKKIEESKNING